MLIKISIKNNKEGGQPMEWAKIVINHKFGKGLTYKIYKDLLQLNSKKSK